MIAIDFNTERIVRALQQIAIYDSKVVPKICCLPFQRPCIFKLLKRFGCQKSVVVALDHQTIAKIFPELQGDDTYEPYRTKEGECIAVSSRNTRAAGEAAPKKRQTI